MRILLSLVAAALLALPAYAQTTAAKSTHTRHATAQQFEQANITHDGHLTLEQAQNGYKSVAKHFTAIDQDNKGYITEDDIRAYNKTQQTLHHQPESTHRTPNG